MHDMQEAFPTLLDDERCGRLRRQGPAGRREPARRRRAVHDLHPAQRGGRPPDAPHPRARAASRERTAPCRSRRGERSRRPDPRRHLRRARGCGPFPRARAARRLLRSRCGPSSGSMSTHGPIALPRDRRSSPTSWGRPSRAASLGDRWLEGVARATTTAGARRARAVRRHRGRHGRRRLLRDVRRTGPGRAVRAGDLRRRLGDRPRGPGGRPHRRGRDDRRQGRRDGRDDRRAGGCARGGVRGARLSRR